MTYQEINTLDEETLNMLIKEKEKLVEEAKRIDITEYPWSREIQIISTEEIGLKYYIPDKKIEEMFSSAHNCYEFAYVTSNSLKGIEYVEGFLYTDDGNGGWYGPCLHAWNYYGGFHFDLKMEYARKTLGYIQQKYVMLFRKKIDEVKLLAKKFIFPLALKKLKD